MTRNGISPAQAGRALCWALPRPEGTVAESATVQTEGRKQVTRETTNQPARVPGVARQSVTNRHQLQTGSRSVSQPVTNCHQLTDLFQRDKSVISRHMNNLFEEGELVRSPVVAEFAITEPTEKMNPPALLPGTARQLVSNCYQLNSRAFCPSQPVTSCYRLNPLPTPHNLIPPP